ncbi:MAG: hypothetical protein ACJ8DP_19660, partial [Microvirga sp.]
MSATVARTAFSDCPCCMPRRGFLAAAVMAGATSFAATTAEAQAVSGQVPAASPQPAAGGGGAGGGVIVDCHGHYTTEPKELLDWRKRQIDALKDPSQTPSRASLKISDDQLRESVEGAQLKLQRERGTNVTIFSPRAGG